MNPTDPSPEKGKLRQPKSPSTPSEPAAPAASKSLAPWELTEQMDAAQRKLFAEELVKLYREKKAQEAKPPAASPAANKPKMTDE